MATKFFVSCKGVFQGGGCRGVALAGAYDAAHKQGVRFSEVAGTSAGSIIAALIGAGASPEEILDLTKRLDYLSFLAEPQEMSFQKSMATWLTGLLAERKLPRSKQYFSLGGMYSSKIIENWLNGVLSKLLPGAAGTVTFGDLPLPTYVVAGNLRDKSPKIWSTTTTPNESVALAVRASCSIPIFFQPVQIGEMLFVDGGILANLPLFVFYDSSQQRRSSNEKILAFALGSVKRDDRPRDSFEYILKLANLTVEGATNIQKSLQSNVSVIEIDTKGILATDFAKMNAEASNVLLEEGRVATEKFFANEHLYTAGISNATESVWDEHQAFNVIVEQADSARKQVIIADTSTNWFWELFPTVLGWRKRGIEVICFTPQPTVANALRENQRIAVLNGMGAKVIHDNTLQFSGVIIDGKELNDSFALVNIDGNNGYLPRARVYRGREHDLAIKSIFTSLEPKLGSVEKEFSPSIARCDIDQIQQLLRTGVSQYQSPKVRISFEDVPVEAILLLSRYVRNFRLRQLPFLCEALHSEGIELYHPAVLRLAEGLHSIITPPVFELVGENYVAIEGNTRCYLAYQNHKPVIKGFVVRGVTHELPGRPVALKNVRIATTKMEPSERMAGFNHSLFRSIERATHPLGE